MGSDVFTVAASVVVFTVVVVVVVVVVEVVVVGWANERKAELCYRNVYTINSRSCLYRGVSKFARKV